MRCAIHDIAKVTVLNRKINIDAMGLSGLSKYRNDLVKLNAVWEVIKEEIERWEELNDRNKYFIHMTVRMILVDSHSFLKQYREFLTQLHRQNAYFKQYSWRSVDIPKTQWMNLPGEVEVTQLFKRKHHERKQKEYIESRKRWIASFFEITIEEIPDQKVPNFLFDKKVSELQEYIDSIKNQRNQQAHIFDYKGEPENTDLVRDIGTTLEYCKDQISKLYKVQGAELSWDLKLF